MKQSQTVVIQFYVNYLVDNPHIQDAVVEVLDDNERGIQQWLLDPLVFDGLRFRTLLVMQGGGHGD